MSISPLGPPLDCCSHLIGSRFLPGFRPGPGTRRCLAVDWVEGVAIIVAIFIVVCVFQLSHNRFARSLHIFKGDGRFPQQLAKGDDSSSFSTTRRRNEVLRLSAAVSNASSTPRSLLVGDIAPLEPGETTPCDGIFISGHNVRCDESSTTGESDAIKKVGYDECISLREADQALGCRCSCV
jgi:Ca2+-transporting ATPase